MASRQKTASRITTALLHTACEEPHFHQELEVLYLIEGALTVIQDGRETVMGKSDVLVINCNHTHALHGQGELTLLQVQVSYDLLQEIAPGGDLLFLCNSAADAYHPYGEVRRYMRQLLLSYAGARRRTAALRYSYIYALLDLLIEHFRRGPEASDGRPPQEEDRLQAVISYVNENFREPVNLGKLAEQMYLSTSSLSRLFKRSMGCYFADFVNHVRLNHAVQELVSTDKTVTRIAADCGFATLAAFNKQFQAAYHTTPAAWRKQQWEQGDAAEEARLQALQQDIARLHLEAEPEPRDPGARSLAVTVAAGPGTAYTRNWDRVLNAGAARDMTVCNVQGHVTYLCEQLGFRHVRIWNLFSRQMMITRDAGQYGYNFDMLDNVLDFMTAHRMVPYLDFGQRPACAVRSEGEMVYYEENPWSLPTAPTGCGFSAPLWSISPGVMAGRPQGNGSMTSPWISAPPCRPSVKMRRKCGRFTAKPPSACGSISPVCPSAGWAASRWGTRAPLCAGWNTANKRIVCPTT